VIPSVFAIGGAIVDNVVDADGAVTLELLGGNALYAAAGARIFAPRAGAVARVPGDYPLARAQAALGASLDLAGLRVETAASATPEWFFHAGDGSRRDHLHGPSSLLATHGSPLDRLSPVQAAASRSPPSRTRTMGRSICRANSQSRWSWPGTAMIAPVP
jgi:hypothetical protein